MTSGAKFAKPKPSGRVSSVRRAIAREGYCAIVTEISSIMVASRAT
jgi:hypothetical protein